MSTTDTTVIVLHNPPHRRRRSKTEPPRMRIVLLGSSVSENSLVGNFILGRAAFDSEAPPDVVERVAGRLKDRHVIIINSPQLLQTNISDHQITQTVRECVNLSDPGPHVIILLLKHEQYSAEDQERVEKVLRSFSESVYQHTMVLSTQEPTETSDILQKIILKCANRHFSLQSSSSPDDLLQTLEHIEKMNDGRYLDCAEASQCFMMEQQTTERLSESVKLNLVLCGSDDSLKSSVSEQILQQTNRRSDVDLHDRLIDLLKLPALIGLSEEEVMRQTLRCVSLCHPGVHAFLLIIPDAPLNNEDKAEMEEIQRIFSSRINKHIVILIKQSSEHQTEELSEETQSVIQSFGGRHQFFGPKTQVSTLMENIEQMLEENRGDCFSTEMFLEAQMKKLMKHEEEMKKKINLLETHLHNMKREQEKLEKQKQEEKMKREEEDEKRREKEQRDCDEFNQRLKQERERMKREKEDLQSKHEEENKKKILMDKLNREREELMKKHEKEKERMKMMMDKLNREKEEEMNKHEEEKEKMNMMEKLNRERKELMKKLKEEKERKRGSGYLAMSFGIICVILLVFIILQHNRFTSIINSRQGITHNDGRKQAERECHEKFQKEKQEFAEKIKHETRRQAERECQEKLVKEVAEALKEAEAKLPYRAKRARDWGYYIPVVGAAAGAVLGSVEDIFYGTVR